MAGTTGQLPSDAVRAAAEQAEREEMFSFHPDILQEAAPLPRRVDGSDYDPARTREQQP